jgi:hypothetical protein
MPGVKPTRDDLLRPGTQELDETVIPALFYGPDLAAEIHARAGGYKHAAEAAEPLVGSLEAAVAAAKLRGAEEALRDYAVEVERRTPGDPVRSRGPS